MSPPLSIELRRIESMWAMTVRYQMWLREERLRWATRASYW